MSELVLKNQTCQAIINYHGAELKSFKKNGKEYMWCADPAFWGRTSPVLFPFVGAVSNNTYTYNGKDYPMSQHGFARDMDFELLESTDTSCKFILKSDETTRSKYPLDFTLVIGYELCDSSLKIIWEVINTGNNVLEFSIGAHPAFSCILNDSSIRISKNEKPLDSFINSVFGKGLLTDKTEEIILSNGIMKLDEHSFDGDAYVIENSQSDCVEILDKNQKTVLSVKYSSPLVGIWSPPGKNAPFLCIEPWYGRADKEGFVGELKDREWNNSLEKDKHFKAEYVIEV